MLLPRYARHNLEVRDIMHVEIYVCKWFFVCRENQTQSNWDEVWSSSLINRLAPWLTDQA